MSETLIKPKNEKSKISTDCLKAFVSEGFTQAEIGRCCSLSRERVRQRVKKANIKYLAPEIKKKQRDKDSNAIRKLANMGYTLPEIIIKLKPSIPQNRIYHLIRWYKIKVLLGGINRKRLCEILFLRNKGYSKVDIARELKIFPQTLTKTLKKITLKFPHGNERGG